MWGGRHGERGADPGFPGMGGRRGFGGGITASAAPGAAVAASAALITSSAACGAVVLVLAACGGAWGGHRGFPGFPGWGGHEHGAKPEKPGAEARKSPVTRPAVLAPSPAARGPGGTRSWRPRRPGPGMFAERALKDLNLNDKEKAKVEDVLKAHREKAQKAFESMREDFEKATKDVTDKDKLAEARKAQGEKMKKTFESLRRTCSSR